jgi:peroxiredoxin
MADTEPTFEPEQIPDERPQRRREYSGAGSTLGVAALIVLAVAVAIWWFELRGGDSGGASDDGFGIVSLPADLNPTGKAASAETGRAAPNFDLPDLHEGSASLTDYRGKWVLVNFWASWCGPCRSEVPDLQELAQRRPDKLVVLGVNQQESDGAARKFVDEFGVEYPVLLDRSGEVSQAYRALGLPVSYLVNPQGVIVKGWPGRISEDELKALDEEYLAQ